LELSSLNGFFMSHFLDPDKISITHIFNKCVQLMKKRAYKRLLAAHEIFVKSRLCLLDFVFELVYSIVLRRCFQLIMFDFILLYSIFSQCFSISIIIALTYNHNF
jgi:hypothetical protein